MALDLRLKSLRCLHTSLHPGGAVGQEWTATKYPDPSLLPSVRLSLRRVWKAATEKKALAQQNLESGREDVSFFVD